MGLSVYVILLLIFMFLQSYFLYFPSRYITMTPAVIGLSYENVYLKTSDKIKLHSWFIPANRPKGVVLFCHGNAGNISHRIDSIRIFNQLGLSTFIFDYRGYGKSKGKLTEEGTYIDAETAWNYLVKVKKVSPSKLIIFGRSLGGSIASWLAKQHTPGVLIIESTYTSVPDIASGLYPYFPVRLLCRFRYSTKDYLKKVKCPVMIIHSRNDEIIPFSHGQKLFEAGEKPKEFLKIKGAHNEGFIISAKKYMQGIASFISEYVVK